MCKVKEGVLIFFLFFFILNLEICMIYFIIVLNLLGRRNCDRLVLLLFFVFLSDISRRVRCRIFCEMS